LVLQHRYAYQSPRRRKLTEAVLWLYIAGAMIYFAEHLPRHPLILAFFLVAVVIVILNNRFYLFLAARRGRLFALAAVPFHLLYHLYNGISFAAGLIRYLWRRLTGRFRPPAPGPIS